MVSARWLEANPSDDSSSGGAERNFQPIDLMETGGVQLAAEKTLAKIRKMFWLPKMRTDVERKANWCPSRAYQSTEGSRSERRVKPHLIGESVSLR